MADPRYKLVSPFDTSIAGDPSQDPLMATQYGLMNPLEGMSMPSFPSLPQGAGNTALNLAGILGGLGLGLARPRIAPQALQNFSASNMMEWRDAQREFAQQRLGLAQREEDTKRAILAQIMAPESGAAPPPQFATPPPSTQSSAPQVSDVPHFALSMPGGAGPAPQFTPEARLATPPDQPFLTGPPTPIRGNTSTGISAYGLSKTQSTTRGTEKEQATNAAINDLTTAWIENPDQAQQNPRRLLKEVMQRYPMADSKEIRQNLSNTLFETYHTNTLQNPPGLDPKSAYRQAYGDAARDLGAGLFMPTDQMRTLATQVAGEGEHRGLAIGKDDTSRLGQLNIYEGNQRAAIRGAENAADFATKPYAPSDAQKFATPPPVGTTPRQQAGRAPMSVGQETNITVSERERTDRQVKLEAAAPMISSIIDRAEQIRKSVVDLNLMNLYQKGKNWLDVAQAQLTGLPQTELGKLVTSYDDMVLTSGPFMARSVQSNVGALTENEQAVGRLQLPRTFRELVNNPVAGNDRLAVMSLALSIDLRDPTFRLSRLDVPASEFEKSVMAHRQKLIQTRPELFTNAPTVGAPQIPQGANAPPTLSGPMLTPEDQAISDQINRELQQNVKPRKK